MSYYGNTKIGKMFLGGTGIAKAYLGSVLVFQKGQQPAPQPQQQTLTKYPSSYDSDHAYQSLSNASRAYTSATSTTYANILMVTGARAESYIFFKFDVSAIPAGATIEDVSCDVKTNLSSGTANIPTANICLYSGTTAKGSAVSVTGTGAKTKTLTGQTWTRQELDDIRVRFYGQRGSSNTSTNRYMRFYGATLTITYTA